MRPASSTLVCSAAVAACLLLFCIGTVACHGPAKRGRSVPICAVQDCATHKMVDDGCADDGRCASCVNTCPPPASGAGPR
ncbi:MAG TPA: hypothetical protein VIF15_10430 [Polyangiaceae bacterium]|jgi:hypothetical protein